MYSTQRPSDRCAGRWIEVFQALVRNERMMRAIELGPRKHTWCPDPYHTDQRHGDAFRVMPDFTETGRVICNRCGCKFGFGALMWLNGWDAQTTGQKLREFLDDRVTDRNIPRVASPPAPPPAAYKKAGGPPLARLQELWTQAVPLDHSLAEPVRLYFRSRKLEGLPLWPVLRCHPRLGYYEWDAVQKKSRLIGTFPALLAQLSDATGRFIGLHRTYLTEEGAKAPVPTVKKLLTASGEDASGGAVRLVEGCADTLGVAEGLETTFAVYLATGMPVWATTSAPLMGALVVPQSVRRTVIWADLDKITVKSDGSALEPGRDAAQKLKARLCAEWRDARDLYPKLGRRGVDWHDVWVEKGAAGFPTLHQPLLALSNFFSLRRRVRRTGP